MTPTQRKAMDMACKVLDYAAEVADRPGLMKTCEDAANALRAALAEPVSEEPLTEAVVLRLYREAWTPDTEANEILDFARAIERAHGIGGGE